MSCELVNKLGMKYRLCNQFLEMWFQHLDSWLLFLARMEVSEDRDIFIEITKETMQHFINRLDFINTDVPLDLATVWEDETKYD